MPGVVIDASALVELLLGRPRAPAVRAALVDSETIAPQHLDVEILSALRSLARRGEIAESRARVALRRLATSRIERYPLPPLLDDAWVLREHVSAYDAVYLALARRLSCPLLTADRRLAATPALAVAITVV